MKRKCLRCNKVFMSEGSHNRSCYQCFLDINYPEIEQEIQHNYYIKNAEKLKANARAYAKARRNK